MKGLRKKLCYGIGNLGYSVVNQTITNFFMFFGTSVLKVPGSLIGLAVALSTIWDAVTDPIVGFISDNHRMGFLGYRNGYVLIGTIGVSIVNLFIWCVPLNLSVGVKFAWVLICLLLNETFCTLYSTPYGALCGDLVSDYNDRTEIQIYKTIFFILGMVLPSILLYIFLPNTTQYPQGQLNPYGYRNIAIACSCIMLVCGMICVFGTLTRQDKKVESTEKFSLKHLLISYAQCFKNYHLRLVIIGYSLSMISSAILTSVGLHFFTYCFKYSSLQITILLSTLLVFMAISQPFWYKLSKRDDKKPALLSGLLVAIVGVIIIMLSYVFKDMLGNISFYIILLAICVVGVGSGTLYSLPASMYLDVAEYSNPEKNNGATMQSYLTFSYNIANATALFLVGVLLDVIKFNPNITTQSRPTQTGISIILFLGVLISLISSFLVFSKYKLKQKNFNKESDKIDND